MLFVDMKAKHDINFLSTHKEKDGLEYIIGYIGRKFMDKNPYLGRYSSDLKEDHCYSQLQSYVKHISAGGLYKPSASFLDQGLKNKEIFQRTHKDGKLIQTKRIVHL
uniref:Transposable element P transposase-like C-terminal domain-containing protein n=1 Tax=Anopheles arabiensis TaxID=7173 RepID=A0A182I0Z4_ANOAR